MTESNDPDPSQQFRAPAPPEVLSYHHPVRRNLFLDGLLYVVGLVVGTGVVIGVGCLPVASTFESTPNRPLFIGAALVFLVVGLLSLGFASRWHRRHKMLADRGMFVAGLLTGVGIGCLLQGACYGLVGGS